jgi:phosphoribosylanthranilate isomerase
VRGRAQKVALTVDADDATLDAVVEALAAGYAAACTAGSRRRGLRAQAALRPAGDEGDRGRGQGRPRRHPGYATVADRLLFDARAPREATRPGGLGKPFDWRLLENLDPGVPFMLSGGLDAGNVGEALRITRAPGVDVSSGVERAPARKDPDKIRAFVRAARAAAEQSPSGGVRKFWP